MSKRKTLFFLLMSSLRNITVVNITISNIATITSIINTTTTITTSTKTTTTTTNCISRTKPADAEACEGVSVISSSPSFLGVQAGGGHFSGGKNPNVRTISRENLRVKAFSNVLAQESVCRPGPNGGVSIEMVEPQRKR